MQSRKTTFIAFGLAGLLAAGNALAEDREAADPTSEKQEEPAVSAQEGSEQKAAEGTATTEGAEAAHKPAKGTASEADADKPAAGRASQSVAAPAGEVARAAFTSAVKDREPVDEVERVKKGTKEVLFFTELRGMKGQTITHRWIYQGETKAEVTFDVGGPRWRVYSSKDLLPEWTGKWTVEVVNGNDRVVHQDSIVVGSS